MAPMIPGDYRFAEDQTFDGMIGGSATVPSGRRVILTGMVGGDLIIEDGGQVEIRGMVAGRVQHKGVPS